MFAMVLVRLIGLDQLVSHSTEANHDKGSGRPQSLQIDRIRRLLGRSRGADPSMRVFG